jgi:hypothetical protein
VLFLCIFADAVAFGFGGGWRSVLKFALRLHCYIVCLFAFMRQNTVYT